MNVNEQKRILSVQDISCLGKCSNTVALPVLSAAGHECVMLPTALLSTHTAGFTGFTFLDLTEEMKKILDHYDRAGFPFDAVMTGYFGSGEQIGILQSWMASRDAASVAQGGKPIRKYIDPVLGDGGKLYSIYDDAFVAAMRELTVGADLVTPNRTEACLVNGVAYEGEGYHENQLEALLSGFREKKVAKAVITGIRLGENEIGVCAEDFTDGSAPYLIKSRFVEGSFHGAGDLFTAALVGLIELGVPLKDALDAAVPFVGDCLADCIGSGKLYGPMFENRLASFFLPFI